MSLTVAQEKRNKRFALKRAQRAIANAGLQAHAELNNKVVELRHQEAVEVSSFIEQMLDHATTGRMTHNAMLHELSNVQRFFH